MTTRLATPTPDIRCDSDLRHKVEYRFRLNIMITLINVSVRSCFLRVFFNDVFRLQMINDMAVELPSTKFRDSRRATCNRDAYRLVAMAAHSVNWSNVEWTSIFDGYFEWLYASCPQWLWDCTVLSSGIHYCAVLLIKKKFNSVITNSICATPRL